MADAANARPDPRQAQLVLVSGPSGAGRSTSIAALEDAGYETIDNLPLSLVFRVATSAAAGRKPLAVGVDVRNRDFSTDAFLALLTKLRGHEALAVKLLYVDCSGDILMRRYSETRRRHPLAPAETADVGIERELDLLAPIRDQSDIKIDTSAFSVHDLRAEVARWFAAPGQQGLAVSVQSFSYKRGLPQGLDLVFDVRFLRNPYWSEPLRPLDGRDADVLAYIREDTRFEPFFARLVDLLEVMLPAYVSEGKSHLSIGFGCTGGQHRSVAVTENLAATLAQSHWQVSIRHQELDRRHVLDPRQR